MDLKQEPVSLIEKEKDLELEDTTTTIYHIYHTGPGKHPPWYSIHTISDTNTDLIPPPKKPKKPKKSKSKPSPEIQTSPTTTTNALEKPPADEPTPLKRTETTSTLKKPLSKFARSRFYDRPKYDPRCETSPYFVHLPTLVPHQPPFTLRHGGNKKAPVAGLIGSSFAFRRWTLQFGDVFKEDGVVDGRGVVNYRFGSRKGEDGTLRGYKVSKKRWWGETGKEWFRNYWIERNKLEVDNGKEEEQQWSVTPKRAEEIVYLRWKAPISTKTREYRFEWRGFQFAWKGTGKVTHGKAWKRNSLKFNHLKLVVIIPDLEKEKMGNDVISGALQKQNTNATTKLAKVKAQEIVLAKYTSSLALRKAGRLDVFQEIIDSFLAGHGLLDSSLEAAYPSEKVDGRQKSSEKSPGDIKMANAETEKTRQRIRDIIVGTAICMVIGEYTKRKVVIDILIEIAQNGGG